MRRDLLHTALHRPVRRRVHQVLVARRARLACTALAAVDLALRARRRPRRPVRRSSAGAVPVPAYGAIAGSGAGGGCVSPVGTIVGPSPTSVVAGAVGAASPARGVGSGCAGRGVGSGCAGSACVGAKAAAVFTGMPAMGAAGGSLAEPQSSGSGSDSLATGSTTVGVAPLGARVVPGPFPPPPGGKFPPEGSLISFHLVSTFRATD
jgi:hypothetical protein